MWFYKTFQNKLDKASHPATRRCGDIVTTSLSMFQWRRRYVSNKTPNDVSIERRQDVSVVCLNDVFLECRDDVSWGSNNDVPSLHLLDDSSKSKMKHPTIPPWYVTRTSQWYELVRLYDVFSKSEMKHLLTSLWYVVHDLHLEGFHLSFKYQIKNQIFLVPTRRETIRVVWTIT